MSGEGNGHSSNGHGRTPAFPAASVIIARLRDVYGPEEDTRSPFARWIVQGAAQGRDVSLRIDRNPPVRENNGADDDGASVIWVTRPDEPKAERCPIITLRHLEAFLAMVSIARRSPEPVHGNVCPGTD